MAAATRRAATWRVAPGCLESPLIIAHRGDSSAAPENTMESFRSAVAAGADGIELDVRLTRDGEVAVIHDRRVDRTTNGSGQIGAFTMAEVQQFDAGSWFAPEFKSARVPSLGEVFEELPPSFLVNVELKVRGTGAASLVSKVVEVVRRHDRLDSVLVASFNPLALSILRAVESRIVRGYVWNRRHPLPMRARWMSPLVGPHWMDPDRDTFTPEVLERSHGSGRPVLAWDLDVGTDLKSVTDMGLDAVVTDRLDVWLRQRA